MIRNILCCNNLIALQFNNLFHVQVDVRISSIWEVIRINKVAGRGWSDVGFKEIELTIKQRKEIRSKLDVQQAEYATKKIS